MHANHSATLNTLFDRDGFTATLMTAVPVGRALAEHLEPSQHEVRVVLGNLGMSLPGLYERTHDLALLTEAEDHTKRPIATAIGSRRLCSPCSPTSVRSNGRG